MYTSPWAWEVSSLIGVFVSFAALVILLVVFDGRAIWVWKSVTLNTVVSTLSMVLRAFLLFPMAEGIGQWKWILFDRSERSLMDFERVDQASRGPWGSVCLAWRKDVPWLLRIGVIVTILALAVDPFSQQLLQIEHQVEFIEVEIGFRPLSPRTYEYRHGHLFKVNETKSANESTDHNVLVMRAQADLSMQAAILRGLSQPDQLIKESLDITCSQGNCTWPTFDTLGVCHRCEGLGPQLRRVHDFGDIWEYMRDSDNGDDRIPKENATAVVLPNGHFLANVNGCLTDKSALYDGCEWPVNGSDSAQVPGYEMTSYGTGKPNETITMQNLDHMIWAMSVLFVDEDQQRMEYVPGQYDEESYVNNSFDPIREDPDADLSRWPDSPVRALECALYYCVKTVDDIVKDRVLMDETHESEEAVRKPDSWKPRNEGNYAPENISPKPDSFEFDETYSALEMTDLVFYYPNASNYGFASDKQREFSLSHEAVMSISAFFKDNLRTQWKNNTAMLDLVRERVPNASVVANGRVRSSDVREPQALEGIYDQWKRVHSKFEHLAISMTNDIRGSGKEELDPEGLSQKIPNDNDHSKIGLMGTHPALHFPNHNLTSSYSINWMNPFWNL